MNYREGIQRKDWTKWTINSIQGMSYGAFYFNGQNVSEKELKELMADENVNFDYDDFVDYLNKNLDGNDLGKLLKNNIVFPFGVTEVGMHCDLQLEEVQTYSSSVEEGKLIVHFDLCDNINDEVWNFGCKVIFNVEIPNYNMMLEKKNLKESKEFFVGSKTWQGYDVYMIEDGKKYYLSKLAKNIEDSSWSSDFTYAKHWKDESRAKEIVDILNSELKESKKSFKERSEENEIIVSELQDTVEYFCGLYEEDKELKGKALESLKNAVERLEVFNAIGSIYQWGVEVLNKCGVKYKGLKESKKVMNEKVDSRYKYAFNHTKDEHEIVQFDDYNFEILAIPNDKSIFSDDLPKFKIEKTYIYDTCVNNKDITLFVGIVEELGWCFIAFDKLANNNNIFAYYISGKTKEGAYHSFHEYKSEYNLRCEESKKSSTKILKESAKPINEKNVAKFVDELNKWCDDNIHYIDADSARFTKKYGKLYDFKYNFDHSFGDADVIMVWDDQGTLDLFEDDFITKKIDELAKKYGWYTEPYHNGGSDFTFGEL